MKKIGVVILLVFPFLPCFSDDTFPKPSDFINDLYLLTSPAEGLFQGAEIQYPDDSGSFITMKYLKTEFDIQGLPLRSTHSNSNGTVIMEKQFLYQEGLLEKLSTTDSVYPGSIETFVYNDKTAVSGTIVYEDGIELTVHYTHQKPRRLIKEIYGDGNILFVKQAVSYNESGARERQVEFDIAGNPGAQTFFLYRENRMMM